MRFTLTCLAGLLISLPLLARADETSNGRVWATHIEEPGLPNFARVNAHLYRGAQPTAAGFKRLEELGIRTVVSFRHYHTDDELLAGTRLTYVSIPMTATRPHLEDVVEFLKLAADTNRWPIFMHCEHGSDRTGVQAAACRMVFDGWTAGEAVDEMTGGGFGFHSIFWNLEHFVRGFDAADLRQRAGLVAAGKPLRILALGDSYTIGEGVEEDARWPNQLAELLRERGREVESPQIIAATGWTTFDLHRAMSRADLAPPYDIVTLLVGVNDQYQGQSADAYRTRFEKLLADAVVHAGSDGARVIVLSIPDYSLTPFAAKMDTARIRSELDAFNVINRDAARGVGASYVDLSGVAQHPGADGLHPSGQMYAEWARLVAEAIQGVR